MKLNKIFAAMMAVVTLVAFSACNQQGGADVIKLKLNNMTLTVGQTYKIPVEQASGAITWATSDAKVVTVDAEGVATGVAEGTAAITATVGSAKATVSVTVGGSGPAGGAPDLEAPAAGKLKVVIEIPEGTECNGIALKGTFNGTDWSGENTYLGEDGAQTPVDGAIYKFAAVPDYAGWWVIEVPASEAMEFKVCLIYKNDGSWEGQATDVALHTCNYSTIEPKIEGGQCKEIGANGGLLYLSIGGWNKSECVVEEQHEVKIALIAPADDCGAEVPVVVGSFCGWDIEKAVVMTTADDGKTYTATIMAYPSDEFKFAGSVSGWANEPVIYNPDEDKMQGIDNIKVGADVAFEVDLSSYSWSACPGEEEE